MDTAGVPRGMLPPSAASARNLRKARSREGRAAAAVSQEDPCYVPTRSPMPPHVPRSAPGIGDLRDAAGLFALASLLGLASLGVRSDVPWLAPPPETVASCMIDDDHEGWDALGPHDVPRIGVDEVAQQLAAGRVTIVDCRPVEAFSQAHIPGALSVPAHEAEVLLGTQTLPIPPDHLVVAYCDGDGSDAESVGRLLGASAGCSQVHVLDGGWGAWIASGAPVTEASHRG